MAVLGAQLVLTLVMVSFIQKLNPHFSFAKWILCSTGLYRYLHPTDDELRTKAAVPKYIKTNTKQNKAKSAGKNINNIRNGTGATTSTLEQFHIPCNIDIDLATAPILERDIQFLRFFPEYQWLVDFSLYAGVVYLLSEVYHYYIPLKDEVNLSLVWCFLVVFFCMKLLSSLNVLYFMSEESVGERSMVILSCLVYLLIAMIVLIIDEKILETGLEDAYASFNASAFKFLNEQNLPHSGPASKIVVKFFIALSCGFLGSLFTFPGLRMAKLQWDTLRYCKDRKVMQFILHISFILPFVVVILWIRPISRDYLTVRIFGGMQKPLLDVHVFETLRLLLVVFVVIVRFSLLPLYLQTYLNSAYERGLELRKQAGRITNIEFQRKISSIFHYLCVVTLQFSAPLILCLFLTLLYKNLAGYHWSGLFAAQNTTISLLEETEVCAASILSNDENAGITPMPVASLSETLPELDDSYDADIIGMTPANGVNIIESARQMHTSLIGLKSVFSSQVYKGFLGFAIWWSNFTLFTSTLLGIIYQSYFNRV